jgi:hypothetical protein
MLEMSCLVVLVVSGGGVQVDVKVMVWDVKAQAYVSWEVLWPVGR